MTPAVWLMNSVLRHPNKYLLIISNHFHAERERARATRSAGKVFIALNGGIRIESLCSIQKGKLDLHPTNEHCLMFNRFI